MITKEQVEAARKRAVELGDEVERRRKNMLSAMEQYGDALKSWRRLQRVFNQERGDDAAQHEAEE